MSTVTLSDLFIIERGGVQYSVTGQDIVNYITDSIGTSEHVAVDIAARDALTGLSLGDRVEVTDASADATVDAGWAIYAYTGAGFKKVAEEEGLDVIVGNSDLGITRTANNVTISNSNGTDATIPDANPTQAGVMTAAQFNKLAFITVTAGIDLDAILANAHVPMTTSGTATTNPIQITVGQVASFSISSLASAP